MNLSELIKICGIGLIAAFAAVILRELRKEYVPVILLGMSVMALFAVMPVIEDTALLIRELGAKLDSGYVGIILRGIGITYLTGMACEICRSVGENGIAGTIETVGRAELLLMCVPLFRDLLEVAVTGR